MSVYKCLLCGKPFGTLEITNKPVCDECKASFVSSEDNLDSFNEESNTEKEKPCFRTTMDSTLKGLAILVFVASIIGTLYLGSYEQGSTVAALSCFFICGFFSILLCAVAEIISALKFIANK